MTRRYEVGGVLEDSRVIRLNEALPCKEGPVKVVVETTEPEGTLLLKRNRAAEPEPEHPTACGEQRQQSD